MAPVSHEMERRKKRRLAYAYRKLHLHGGYPPSSASTGSEPAVSQQETGTAWIHRNYDQDETEPMLPPTKHAGVQGQNGDSHEYSHIVKLDRESSSGETRDDGTQFGL